ncbi:UPF0280 family protein [Methanolapillus ohkumae]|uniref:UPF0280 protein MsAm2_09770 n=1 Tax=Methanolapillus ohkumae TaxID=3028298 RepID=A0AA96ZX10_9EURY|nr:hypothetical protein MsAm2_09770 [Methanosarcinaceae archaeon Am2]
MIKCHFEWKETIVTILADSDFFVEIARKEIAACRFILENYISKNPFFKTTLETYGKDPSAPPLIQRMIEAANTFGIGPMSTVAGTIAESAVLKMKEAGAVIAVVDNGGDIALYNAGEKPLVIGIYAGKSDFKNLGFSIEPAPDILGICTSSGTVGHSISFGISDAAIIFSKNVALSDAAATALGNALTTTGAENIKKALFVIQVPGIDGAVLVEGKDIGFWGKIPEIVKAHIDYDLITKGKNVKTVNF